MTALPGNYVVISFSNETTILDINAKFMCIKKPPLNVSQQYRFLLTSRMPT
jgi:hypothetical protein